MEINVIEKGSTLNLDIASKMPEGPKTYYIGAGWDNPNGPVDLDIVAVLLGEDGKLSTQDNLIYFGNKTAPGVQLSEDNQTGEGEGDDESIVINTGALDSSVKTVVIGLACYSAGADFNNAPNPHFRICDGDNEKAEQLADVPANDGAVGDTVLVACKLTRTDDGWTMENSGEYHQKGDGQAAIKGFAELHGA